MASTFLLFGKKYILVYEWRNGGGGDIHWTISKLKRKEYKKDAYS